MIPRLTDRRIVTYGFSPQADVRAINVRLDPERQHLRRGDQRPRRGETASRIDDLHLPMVGQHNVQNALAAIAVADEMGIADDGDPQGASPASPASSAASPAPARPTASP